MAMTALDFEEIKQLHARYCHAIDFDDADGVVACFAPDGCFDLPEQVHRGSGELWPFAADVAKRQGGHVRHSILNPLIDGDGTAARSLAYAVVTHDYGAAHGKGGVTHATLLTSGIYADDLVRIKDRWVYAKRSFRWDGTRGTLDRLGKPLELEVVDTGTTPASECTGMSALDYEAIRQLLTRYGYTLDFLDYEGFVNCFTPDGSFESLSEEDDLAARFQGAERLREFAAAVGERAPGHARHSAISVVIDGNGERAKVSSYGLIPAGLLYGLVALKDGTTRPRGNVAFGTTGIYRDEVVKVDGRWLFAKRTFRRDGWPDVMDLVNRPLEIGLFS